MHPDSTHNPSAPVSESTDQVSDPVFQHEQQHLSKTYKALQTMGHKLVEQMEKTRQSAAEDKRSMSEELAPNFASYADAMETYADFAAMNRVIDNYNQAQNADAEKLATIQLLLKQPYFAKVVLQFKPEDDPKELYIGNAGIADDNYRRLIIDWRSPVAEVYYNQENGPTSYRADGRTIHTDLKLRRQFDIEGSKLNAYFDTSVAIQDSLLLASLSKRRTAHMQAITATIQKEQNQIIRHEDVPTLLVSGIAGSGKTSVLLQRIAYLFYQYRESLDPREVFLITPNPVFQHYIDNVLPDLGERNPETLTWEEFAHLLLPADRGIGDTNISLDALKRIDHALASFELDHHDFKDIENAGVKLIPADQIRKIAAKFKRIPAGSHRITLMREELHTRLQARLKQLAATDKIEDEISALSIEEQLDIFHETIDPQDEKETRAFALRYLKHRHAPAYKAVENDDWLRIDRIGMKLLNTEGLSPIEWLYLKITLTGLGNPNAKYVIIDEVQDYTAAQLTLLAKYFRRAHFLLLGDPNQAIASDTVTFAETRDIFAVMHGPVEECQLLTSYRSSPEITALFAGLLSEEERIRISSIQRDDTAPLIAEYPNEESYTEALRQAIQEARGKDGLTAVIAPWKHEAKRLHALLGNEAPAIIDENATLPACGVVLITLKLAKGLEFDQVIIPNATEQIFPDNPLSRRRLYTTLSRATHRITILAQGNLTPLLKK